MVSFIRKVALMAWPVTLLKKEVIVDVILLILHFFKTPFLKKASRRLLLEYELIMMMSTEVLLRDSL